MNPDDLRTALDQATPDAPTPDGWAAAAKSRAKRARNARFGAVGGLVVVGVALASLTLPGLLPRSGVTAVPAGTGAGATNSAQPQPGTVEPGTPARDPGYPAPTATPYPASGICNGLKAPDALTFVQVPLGAASVQLCDTAIYGLAGIAPPDALTTGVDEVAALVNDQPRISGPGACTADLGPRYTLVFSYPNGTTTAVSGERYGCRVVAGRTGAEKVAQGFLERLTAQRAAQPAPAASDVKAPSDCEGHSWLTPNVTETRAASVCVAGQFTPTVIVKPLPGWATLAQNLPATGTKAEPTDGVPDGARLVAVSARGERVQFWAYDHALWQQGVEQNPPSPGSSDGTVSASAAWWKWTLTDAQWAPIQKAITESKLAVASAALCAPEPALGGFPPLPDAQSIASASRCVQVDGSDTITEYPFSPKQVTLMVEGLRKGTFTGDQKCPLPTSTAAPSTVWLAVGDAEGTISRLKYDPCLSGYRVSDGRDVGVSKQLTWTPTKDDLAWLRQIPTR